MGRKGGFWTLLPHPGRAVLSWPWHRHLRTLRAVGFTWSICKLCLLNSCASTRNEGKENKKKVICIALVCVWEILGSGTQMLCPIWKEDMGAILGICPRSVRDLHCLYKALWGTAFPLKEGNPCVTHKWEVKMKTNFCKWHINGWTAHRKITNILRTKQRWTNIQGEKCVVHLRNAVLGSRNAKEFGIDGEIMQCSIAIKSANGALKWENESNLSSRGGYLFEIGGCAWKALQEHHSIIGKSLDKPKKLKSMSKKRLKAQLLEFQRENGVCLSSWMCLAGLEW